jgi:hypothetical protein
VTNDQSRLYSLLRSPSLAVALIVTAIFSLRWLNCLPFSGAFPALDNVDTLGFVGRYLLFAKEPFQFPLGTIHGLSFPFESAHISRGAIPLFALFFKAAGYVYAPLLEFNYLVFAELLAIFCTAFFACRFLDLLSIRNFWLQLVGGCFVALSPALLFRSSIYYGETFVVLNFPLILMAAYFCVRLYVSPERWKYRLAFALIFPAIALVDLYLQFATFLLVGTAGLVIAAFHLGAPRPATWQRIRVLSVACIAGGVLALISLWMIGNQNNLEAPSRNAIFDNRAGTGWGYGGGFGGGFHVADVFGVMTANPTLYSESQLVPPRSLVNRLDLPLLNKRLQPGQYEGFAFVGSVPLAILLFGLGSWIWTRFRPAIGLQGRPGLWRARFVEWLRDPLHMAILAIAAGCLCLYIFSWGYILHVFGHRLNGILTPSTILAFLYPKFMYARSLGRLAIAFSMLMSFLALWVFYRHIMAGWLSDVARARLIPAVSVLVIAAHLVDIADYLQLPAHVFEGNEIAKTFSDEDIRTLRSATVAKKAVMLAPELLSTVAWNRIGFSIAYHTRIPISGATLGFGEKAIELNRYAEDVRSILNGNIQQILSAYGSIVIAAPRLQAGTIVSKSDVALTSIELKSQDVVLLIPKGSQK